MVPAEKIAKSLFIAGFALCLLQVWTPAYYMTGDGPCHIYNAQIVHDLWVHSNASFYDRFFKIVYQPDPNWFSTIVLALLLFIAKGAVAEKLMLTIYVCMFCGGFYLLLKKISNNDRYVPLMIFVFVFTHSLAMGFYNFSFSIAFYFWVVWSWLCFLDSESIKTGVQFFLFTALIFFTHLIAFSFSVFTCAALVLSYAVAHRQASPGNRFAIYFIKHAAFLALFVAPLLILMNVFTQKEGGMHIALEQHGDRIRDLYQFAYFINATEKEVRYAKITGILLILLFCGSAAGLKFRLRMNKYAGFLFTFLFVLLVYYLFPDDMFGISVMLTQRVQIFVFLLMACCIAYIFPPGKIKSAGSVLLLGCFVLLCVIRTWKQVKAGEAETDYMSCVKYIRPFSVVLPLNFSPNGTNEYGGVIADYTYLFAHGAQYIGVLKPLVVLDNYEANTGYFPVWWKEEVNPYHHLSKDEGMEACPPYATIAEYTKNTGVVVDYVVMWCYKDSYLSGKHFSKYYAEINAGYHKIYTSPTARTILYERNH